LIGLSLVVWFMLRMGRRDTAIVQTPRTPLSDTIAFTCRQCQKRLKVKPASAGKKLKCPGCGKAVLVPKATPDGAEETP
jgi:DNA-directed RNA polymerase subunit RPC12/RpoP